MRWCQGFSEPDSGSDLASLKTTAVLDGDEWVINGQKVWTTQGHHADYCFLLTRTDPDAPKHKGISYLLVPMQQAGIEVRGITQPDGTAEFCEVFFTDARCPKDNVVGGVNNGWKVANSTLGFERGQSATDRLPPLRGGVPAARRRRRGRTARSTTPRSASAWPRYYTKIQILRINGLRTLSTHARRAQRTRRSPRSARRNKMFWSEMHQRAMELALDVYGAAGDARRRRAGVRLVARHPARRAAASGYPVEPDGVGVLLLPLGDDLGRHQPDPAQHRRRARARPAQGAAVTPPTDGRQQRPYGPAFVAHRFRWRSRADGSRSVTADGRGEHGSMGRAPRRRRRRRARRRPRCWRWSTPSSVDELRARQAGRGRRHPHDGHHVHRVLRRPRHRPGLAVRRHPPGDRRRRSGRAIEAGLVQRLRALNRFIDDLYNDQQRRRRRRVPGRAARRLGRTSGPSAAGVRPTFGVWAHICGSDLVRDADGTMYVLEDNLRVPVGRQLRAREPADLQAGVRRPVRAPEHPARRRLHRRAVQAARRRSPPTASADPYVAVLTPGIFNSAYFEHSFLAQRMGAALVEGARPRRRRRRPRLHAHDRRARAGRRDLPPHRRPVPRPRGVPPRLDARRARA